MQIFLPYEYGYLDPEQCQGVFTIVAIDIHQKPIENIAASDVLLYCDGKSPENIEVIQRIPGVYDVRFQVVAELMLGLNQEESRVKPLEVILTVKREGLYSNTLHVPFIR